MDFYKKIIKSKKLRFQIISLFRFVPDRPMLKLQYRIKCGRRLNLAEPKRYTEKIQWYKLNYRDPLMQRCADKYLVRSYVEEKGLGHILNDLYAVFPSPEAITLDNLPDQFVLKLSNGSSTNLLVRNKADLNLEQVRQKFRDFFAQAGSSAGREWVYRDGTPRIIAEQYLTDPDQPDIALPDYKILCFNGEPKYIIRVGGRYTENCCHVVYDTQWNKQEVLIAGSPSVPLTPRPDSLDQMLEIARTLSADFPAVRVDLYSIKDKLYFGELTFFPWSGYTMFEPDVFDYKLGEKFVLPQPNYGVKDDDARCC